MPYDVGFDLVAANRRPHSPCRHADSANLMAVIQNPSVALEGGGVIRVIAHLSTLQVILGPFADNESGRTLTPAPV